MQREHKPRERRVLHDIPVETVAASGLRAELRMMAAQLRLDADEHRAVADRLKAASDGIALLLEKYPHE